jgi:2-polyprenyl-3-methyl-5-hydroxy-6-metoxy-1,4-benzoquinol methylase
MIYKNKSELLHRMVGPTDTVLDVGFLGQGIQEGDSGWPHHVITKLAKEVYGVDLKLSERYKNNPHYQEASAEDFHFGTKFEIIFSGDLIEHLSNPGLFLEACKKHLTSGGRLILTTPNTFNLFNLTEKLTKREPTVNPDHTFYFNNKTLLKLLEKNGMRGTEVSYLYSLEYSHKESFKKKFLNLLYWYLSKMTDKYIETLVIVAVVK